MKLSDIGKIVENFWKEIPNHFPQVILGEYVIMPNHIHGILEITGRPKPVGARHALPLQGYDDEFCIENVAQMGKPISGSLGTIIGSFKSAATKQARIITGQSDLKLWQRNYFEHGIRSDKSLDRIQDYICHNPALWREDEENPEYHSMQKKSV